MIVSQRREFYKNLADNANLYFLFAGFGQSVEITHDGGIILLDLAVMQAVLRHFVGKFVRPLVAQSKSCPLLFFVRQTLIAHKHQQISVQNGVHHAVKNRQRKLKARVFLKSRKVKADYGNIRVSRLFKSFSE